VESQREPLPRPARAYALLGTIVIAYIGVYLCRKNLSVAVPVLQRTWGLTKSQVGVIESAGTFAYAFGKFFWGPVTDRVGGRASLLGSMVLVALFGAAGALAPSLLMLAVLYSTNRLFGSASWGAMVKLVPEWFAPKTMAFACGLLSLSYVFGGALASSFAGLVARFTHESLPALLALPSLVLLALALACGWVLLRNRRPGSPPGATAKSARFQLRQVLKLFRDKGFLAVLALSFTLTLLRETFNFWTVDFLRTEGGSQVSVSGAALLSTRFDLCGVAGILLMGWIYGRLSVAVRKGLLAGELGLLAVLLAALPRFFHLGPAAMAAGVGAIGFLVYGPYSLLSGVLAVEVRGREYTATVAGLVDGVGYIAGFLSGVCFGRILMLGGYTLGFQVMAALTLVSALTCFLLYSKQPPTLIGPSIGPANPCPVVSENP
jgi:sugar phosphate permease